MRLVVLLLAVVALHLQTPLFRTRTEGVTIQVAVKSGNRVVSDLSPAEFELLDSGVRQQVKVVSIGKLPIDLTVLLDLSVSVLGDTLTRLKRALIDTARLLRPDDRIRLVVVSQALHEVFDFQSPADTLPLERLTPGGGTSLYDGLAAAMMRPADAARRQLVVAFTDGRDSTSIIDEATLKQLAGATDAMVGIVVPISRTPFERKPGTPPGAIPAVLQQLVQPTGGDVIPLEREESISGAFRRLVESFRAGYTLQYTPEGVSSTGWHPVTVRITRPGTFVVRARAGYSGR
jgi:VWFA-related protein